MNKYFALRKTNRMRTELLTEKSQEQLKEVIRYLRRVSWDFCGIELVRSDLLDIAIQANTENQELFHSISDAKTFVEEVKPSLKTLRAGDYFWYVAPLYFFFEWGVEGLLLYPVIGNWVFELSVGYLMQLVVAVAAFCILFRRMMEQVGFPPREHWLKYAAWLVLYIVILYGTGWFFNQIAGNLVLLRLPILSYSVFCLLLGAGLYAIHFWRYGKDPRLSARIYITKNRPRRVGALHAAGPMIYWGVYPLRRKLPLSPCRRSRTARSFPCTWPRWPLRREPAACGGRSPCPADPCPLRYTCG